MDSSDGCSDANLDASVAIKQAECACAGGPVFEIYVDEQGAPLSFEKAYPRASNWMKRLAAFVAHGSGRTVSKGLHR